MFRNKGPMQSNLECLLERTTPVVPSKILPKSEIRKLNTLWHPLDREEVEYFTLSDLWNSYDEWSVYGAGVPVTLNDSESLVQYYVPYLSAIQIFTSNSVVTGAREETSTHSERTDSFSDSLSYESESEKLSRSDGCSSEDGVLEQEIACHPKDKLGYLYCQYFEIIAPYGRVPLMDKITELAQRYPRLMSLRSVDLSPASWMAVAWYPIYHIPMGRNVRDLSTCFLTFHTLSSSFQDLDLESGLEGVEKRKRRQGEGISLSPFGLATYKMQGGVWVSQNSGRDQERLASLLSVADSWLRQLKVHHHDFDYFVGYRRG
ncbi:hypothetical protein RHMOL_Rhmol04G0108600 [Rhododendron molle]|uniref:Uncharacterized protein n=1 Tax=Rhododendron molle TaxID=49168 RepID=A0ACC0P0A4_RHOML|nr:hypothetical protein RHMOL_Rhmol04G0108600 [Rhododendron molle]